MNKYPLLSCTCRHCCLSPPQFSSARRQAGAVPAFGRCLSVCVSVTSRHSTETAGRIQLVFGTETSFDLSYTVSQGNSVISKIRVLPSGTLKVRHGTSIIATYCHHGSTKLQGTLSMITEPSSIELS